MTIKRERWQVILKNIDYIDKDTANNIHDYKERKMTGNIEKYWLHW